MRSRNYAEFVFRLETAGGEDLWGSAAGCEGDLMRDGIGVLPISKNQESVAVCQALPTERTVLP